MGAANNQVPRPIAPARVQGAPGRNLDEEKYKLLADDWIDGEQTRADHVPDQRGGRTREAARGPQDASGAQHPTQTNGKATAQGPGFVNPVAAYSTAKASKAPPPPIPPKPPRFHRFHRSPGEPHA